MITKQDIEDACQELDRQLLEVEGKMESLKEMRAAFYGKPKDDFIKRAQATWKTPEAHPTTSDILRLLGFMKDESFKDSPWWHHPLGIKVDETIPINRLVKECYWRGGQDILDTIKQAVEIKYPPVD